MPLKSGSKRRRGQVETAVLLDVADSLLLRARSQYAAIRSSGAVTTALLDGADSPVSGRDRAERTLVQPSLATAEKLDDADSPVLSTAWA